MITKKLLTVLAAATLLISACTDKGTDSRYEPFTWKTTTPEQVGIDPDLLDSAFAHAQQAGFVHSMLVIRGDYLVAEQYYQGYTDTTPHNVMSVSKSFLSAATGLAFSKGYLTSLDKRMLDYFPRYVYPGIDPRKYDITIRHLLTMRMGMENEEENYFELYNSSNWIQSTIEFPLLYDPGSRFSYNTFQTHLLSAIITKATGISTKRFTQRYLTDPMGITIDQWERDPQGYYFGGNAMFFTPREMAVLGLVYLNDGRLGDRQIVPSAWVEFSLGPSTDIGPGSWGAFENYNYAHLWWLGQFGGEDVILAYGFGGQFVAAFPDLELIVVTTANNRIGWDQSTVQEWAIFDIIADYIVPAVGPLQ